VKFADADLRGLPVRVTISDRSLKGGSAELKLPRSEQDEVVPLKDVPDRVRKLLAS
jgi:prolyl-tRNA synthetase